MKKTLFCFLSFFSLAVFSDVLFQKELTLGGKEMIPQSALLEFFMPVSAAGFRILNAEKKSVPVTVLSRTGGKMTVFFNGKSKEKFLLEYTSSPQKHVPAKQLSGLLHLYKPYSGRGIRSAEEFRKEWKKSPLLRVRPETRVYTGMNRLGEARNSLNVYRGSFRASGKIVFYTASTDASFVVIDGKTVASAPGKHGVWEGLHGEHHGTIALAGGTHALEYLHANSQWNYYAILAKSRENEKKMHVSKAEDFVPFLPVIPGKVLKGEEFSWSHTGTVDIDGKQLREIRSSDGKTFHFCTDSSVLYHGYEIASYYDFSPPLVPDKKAKEILKNAWRNAKEKTPEKEVYAFLASAIPMFRMKELAEEFYSMILAEGNLPPETAFKFYRAVMLDQELEKEHYEKCASELLRWLPQNGDPAKIEYAKVLFYGLRDTEKAFQVLSSVSDESSLTGEFKRSCEILKGDLALFREGADRARELYARMESATKKMTTRQIIEADGAMISLRNALLSGSSADAYAYLLRAEKLRPEIRLNPDVALLKARFLFRIGRPGLGAYYAESVLKLHPHPGAGAAALMLLSEASIKAGKKDAAEIYLSRILEEYPRSREALRAEKMLSDGKNVK